MPNDPVSEAMKDVLKKFGAGAITKLTAQPNVYVPHSPTGIHSLDYKVLGIGGLPRGRTIEIYGPEAGGKTTLALTAVAAIQAAGEAAAYIDVENALDPNWMRKNGVDVDKLLVSQPDYGEQALQITESLIESGAFGIIVVDSVAALVPKAELDGEIGDAVMGLQARMMSQTMRKLNSKISKSNTILVFINQIRDKIGVMFGSPEVTTGGKALKFYASVRLDVRRIGQIKEGDVIVGNRVKIKGAKNKVSAPFRETEVELLFEQGFNTLGDLVDCAVTAELVEKSGSWFSYKGDRLGQGRNSAVQFLKDNPDKVKEIKKALCATK